MRERIKQIIEREGMSQSQFADFIGVNRPTLSHVIAGRNNPSIEIVMKIHQKFPKINMLWLLDGIGSYEEGKISEPTSQNQISNLYNEEALLYLDNELSQTNIVQEDYASSPATSRMEAFEQKEKEQSQSRFYQGDLFAENAVVATENSIGGKKRKEMPFQPSAKTPYFSDTQIEYAKKSLQRRIVEIKIFYDDGTYETFKQ